MEVGGVRWLLFLLLFIPGLIEGAKKQVAEKQAAAPQVQTSKDQIEEVSAKQLEKMLLEKDYVAVFWYSRSCHTCDKVLAELEKIDDDTDKFGVDFVKINDKRLAKQYGIKTFPALTYFREKEPIIYEGDLMDEDSVLDFLTSLEAMDLPDRIEEVNARILEKIVEDTDYVAVLFYTNDCDQCVSILEELENIDDDCDKHGIVFVKTQDFKIAQSYGISDFPALVYFENLTPNVYEGDLAEEEEVLQWLITQKVEDRIELVTRNMLESMVENVEYMAVYFYKPLCRPCDQILEQLENIDDKCDKWGIHMVKIQDSLLARRYSIKTFPALVYFRNGNPLLFDGDLMSEEDVFEWLIADENRELADEIEEVNLEMLEKLLDSNPFLAVFYYDDDSAEGKELLEGLEEIDGDADAYGVDFVKISDPDAASKHNVLNSPALVYYRKKTPLLFDGDLHDTDRVLAWLTSQDIFEIKNEIEEVSRKMLDKLLEENDFVAVLFYEEDDSECVEVLIEMENIDGETDNLDITFVKIADPKYARKWGVTKLPSMVYFRKRFPSIYRGDLREEGEVLEWLRKNRFRSPELSIFMYATFAISSAFILYTVFLLTCFKQHPKQA